MLAGLFSEWNSFYSDNTPIPYAVRIYPVSESTHVYYIAFTGIVQMMLIGMVMDLDVAALLNTELDCGRVRVNS